MMLAFLAVALSATPSDTLRIAFPGFTGVGVEKARLEFFDETIDQQLTFAGCEVTSGKELRAVLGLERQRQLLGCSDDTSCMTELAQALDAEALLVGDLSLVGGKYHLTLKLVKSSNGKTLTAFSDVLRGEDEVVDALAKGARVMTEQVSVVLGRAITPRRVLRTNPVRVWSILPAALGLGAGAVGTYFLVQARLLYDRLLPAQPVLVTDAAAWRTQGEQAQLFGFILAGSGAGLLVTAATMFILGKDTSVSTSVAPVPGGAVATFGGAF